ncbi:MAG: serine hydrolase, partial [Bacillota bacterium]|nr:serine hydrolase [Bacillota bacterium]
RGYGSRDLETGLPATPRTLYGIGSITKSFTAIALLQLQEKGLLSLEDPVARYLDFPLRPRGKEVLIHHFLSHTSGIPALAYAEALLGHAQDSGDPYLPIGSPVDLLAFMAKAGDWVVAEPGERWFYLNEGYALLGEIVARVSGQPYDEYVREHILQPLGMERSTFSKDDLDREEDVAIPYVLDGEGRHRPGRYLFGRLLADGGLISSAEDMGRYALFLLSRGKNSQGILSPASIEAMEAPRIPTAPEAIDPQNWIQGHPATYYGLGLSSTPFFGRTLVSHGGSVGVATAQLAYIPSAGVGAVVLANGSGYPTASIAQYALALLLQEDPFAWEPLRVERGLLRWEGVYETYRGTTRTEVRRAGDRLDLIFRDRYGEERVPLIPYQLQGEEARFFTLSGGRRLWVEFREGPQGPEFIYERYLYRWSGRLT